MNLQINLMEGLKVECLVAGHSIIADQPQSKGGTGDHPSPFDYFLASIGLCAGFYVQSYCRARNLDSSEIKIQQIMSKKSMDSNQMVLEIIVEIPNHFSDKDKNGILRSVDGCTVKKTIVGMPEFLVRLS